MVDALGARPGWVYLVGAGPGDPELLTLRGAHLLRTADVVFHDELMDQDVLRHATGEMVSVGKRGSDRQSKLEKQRAINQHLVEAAQAGRRVVRLKGGDPFLFGRGAEEIEALRQHAIPFEIVPGIPSPVGVTAYAGIPLTHRDHASAVTFVTAIQRDGTPYDWGRLKGYEGTICVFMGVRQLATIHRGLVADAGLDPATPAALVEWASRPRQRTVVAPLEGIATAAEEAGIGTPALLVVGSVVGLREQLAWFDRQPLFGKRVLVTRPEGQAEPTVQLLKRRGAVPIRFPTIAIEPPPDPHRVAQAAADLSTYDLVVFTSANGVDGFFRALDDAGRDARAFGSARLAAIGPATSAALARRGIRVDVQAETFVAEHLATAILEAMGERRGRVLLPRARVAREILPDTLRAEGFEVDVVPVYETVGASTERREELLRLLGEVDLVMLTSSSTIEQLHGLLGEQAAALAPTSLASIGPITTATAEKLGHEVAITATVSTGPGLVDAMEAHFRK